MKIGRRVLITGRVVPIRDTEFDACCTDCRTIPCMCEAIAQQSQGVCREDGCGRVLFDDREFCIDHDPQTEYQGNDR